MMPSCAWCKGNDPIESIVRDILVPVQGDYVRCVEIANWAFLHVGASKIAGISATPIQLLPMREHDRLDPSYRRKTSSSRSCIEVCVVAGEGVADAKATASTPSSAPSSARFTLR